MHRHRHGQVTLLTVNKFLIYH